MKKLARKISRKPLFSMVIVSLVSVALTVLVIYSTNLKNAFTPDGLYAVKGVQSIELRGDAELPLYKEALQSLSEIPSGRCLVIYSGFGKYIRGTKFADLVYHGGVMKGDFYDVSVSLSKIKNGAIASDSLYGYAWTEGVPDKLSLKKRKEMANAAAHNINLRMNK